MEKPICTSLLLCSVVHPFVYGLDGKTCRHVLYLQSNLCPNIIKYFEIRVNKVIMNHTSTWNPNETYFDWKGPSFEGLKHRNRGQTGSRYVICII